ncbi:hypothetical protein D3C87_2196110 [compost metagenome]
MKAEDLFSCSHPSFDNRCISATEFSFQDVSGYLPMPCRVYGCPDERPDWQRRNRKDLISE